jgi:hypothetical protein
MESITLTYYWYLIIENKSAARIIKYSKSIYELLSLFRREIESKIYNPCETWLYKNTPTRIILASIPIESLCLNPAQITMEIINYYGLELIKQYTIAKIDHINNYLNNNNSNCNTTRIKLLHNSLPNKIMCDSDINTELCLLDLIYSKLDDIYKLLSDSDEHIYKLYDSMNIHVSWNQWVNDILNFNYLFYPPIEKMRTDLINMAFQTTFIKYNHCYNKYLSYFDT